MVTFKNENKPKKEKKHGSKHQLRGLIISNLALISMKPCNEHPESPDFGEKVNYEIMFDALVSDIWFLMLP